MLRRINWIGLGVSVGVLILGLVALEFAARAFLPQWAPPSADRTFWAYDANLGWVNIPGSSGTMVNRDFVVSVSHNSLGMRDQEYPIERSAGRKRMLVLGSSFAWGVGVEREEVFFELLEAKYPEWEIINAAVSGYSTDQELLYLQEWGAKLQPDVILQILHFNDVSGNINTTRYWHNKPIFETDSKGELVLRNRPVPPVGLKQRIQKYIFSETYFFSKLDLRYRGATKQRSKAARSTTGFEITRDLTLRIGELSDELRARQVVMLSPTGRDDWLAFIGAALDEAGIPHFGLNEVWKDQRVPLKLAHDKHWNPAGHRVVAGELERFLLEREILP